MTLINMMIVVNFVNCWTKFLWTCTHLCCISVHCTTFLVWPRCYRAATPWIKYMHCVSFQCSGPRSYCGRMEQNLRLQTQLMPPSGYIQSVHINTQRSSKKCFLASSRFGRGKNVHSLESASTRFWKYCVALSYNTSASNHFDPIKLMMVGGVDIHTKLQLISMETSQPVYITYMYFVLLIKEPPVNLGSCNLIYIQFLSANCLTGVYLY